MQARYAETMRELGRFLNRVLFLGVSEFEAHYACFPPGGFYRPHLDRHQGTKTRILSAVLYLDQDWTEADGGQLRIYTDETLGIKGPSIDVFPYPGQLVLFLAASIWHQVQKSERNRHTVTGWFRSQMEVPGMGSDLYVSS